MGRYYSGDIQGKFWFAVQSSDDASFFGGKVQEPNHIDYYFETDHIPEIKVGLERCKNALRGYKTKLDKFFKSNEWYNDKMLIEAGFPAGKIKELLEWYARLGLGEKILKCVKEKGWCEFDAELWTTLMNEGM